MTTTPEPRSTATVALRKPDGRPLDDGDVARLAEGTLLVVQVDARPAAPDGDPGVVTIGRVIGWVTPGMAHMGKPMLTGACRAISAAASSRALRQGACETTAGAGA